MISLPRSTASKIHRAAPRALPRHPRPEVSGHRRNEDYLGAQKVAEIRRPPPPEGRSVTFMEAVILMGAVIDLGADYMEKEVAAISA